MVLVSGDIVEEPDIAREILRPYLKLSDFRTRLTLGVAGGKRVPEFHRARVAQNLALQIRGDAENGTRYSCKMEHTRRFLGLPANQKHHTVTSDRSTEEGS